MSDASFLCYTWVYKNSPISFSINMIENVKYVKTRKYL